jgi:hypothetical protein
VKDNEVPEQEGLVPEVKAIETDGVTAAVLFTVIFPEVAVGVVAQPELDVITQLTTSELAKAELANVALFEPAFTPFIFH